MAPTERSDDVFELDEIKKTVMNKDGDRRKSRSRRLIHRSTRSVHCMEITRDSAPSQALLVYTFGLSCER